MTFEVNTDVLKTRLTEAGIEREDFERASSEIADMVLATLQERTKEYIDANVSGLAEDAKVSARADLAVRIEAVSELINARLRSRYSLKVGSKAPSFASLDWDVKVKIFDGALGDTSCPYATVKLTHQRDFDLSPATFFGRNLFDSVSVNMTADEVEFLVQEFQRILATLRGAEEKYLDD